MGNAFGFILKLVAILIFIAALAYFAGFLWVLLQGSAAPEGIQWLYPYIPK